MQFRTIAILSYARAAPATKYNLNCRTRARGVSDLA